MALLELMKIWAEWRGANALRKMADEQQRFNDFTMYQAANSNTRREPRFEDIPAEWDRDGGAEPTYREMTIEPDAWSRVKDPPVHFSHPLLLEPPAAIMLEPPRRRHEYRHPPGVKISMVLFLALAVLVAMCSTG